jgi:AcrR family transcriptional regulator
MKTRERIVSAARALFNESGEPSVSLAQIAAELGISEGNLWYHFRTKRDLIAVLLEELEERIEQNLSRPPTENGNIAAYGDYTQQCFSTMWEYRFLYRLHFDPVKEKELAERRFAVAARCHNHTERILTEMTRSKLLEATPAEISELATTACIIARYWLDYIQERFGLAKVSETDLQSGVKQIFALYRPHLTAEARAQLAAASSARRRNAQG